MLVPVRQPSPYPNRALFILNEGLSKTVDTVLVLEEQRRKEHEG